MIPKLGGAAALVALSALASCGEAPATGTPSGAGAATANTGSNSGSLRPGGKYVVDGVLINWLPVSGMKHPSGSKAALFMFLEDAPQAKMKTGLSVQQRVALAQKLFATRSDCTFSFDPAFHKSLAGNTLSPSSELWAVVDS